MCLKEYCGGILKSGVWKYISTFSSNYSILLPYKAQALNIICQRKNKRLGSRFWTWPRQRNLKWHEILIANEHWLVGINFHIIPVLLKRRLSDYIPSLFWPVAYTSICLYWKIFINICYSLCSISLKTIFFLVINFLTLGYCSEAKFWVV